MLGSGQLLIMVRACVRACVCVKPLANHNRAVYICMFCNALKIMGFTVCVPIADREFRMWNTEAPTTSRQYLEQAERRHEATNRAAASNLTATASPSSFSHICCRGKRSCVYIIMVMATSRAILLATNAVRLLVTLDCAMWSLEI